MPKTSPQNAFIGASADAPGTPKIFFDPDKLCTHLLAAGATGSGKTVAAQVLVEEALKKGVSVVVFDPTAQWTGFLRQQKNDEMLSRYPLFGMQKGEAQAFKTTIKAVSTPVQQINWKNALCPGHLTVLCLNRLGQKPGERPLPQAAASASEEVRETAAKANGIDGVLSYLRKTDAGATEEASELEQFIANSVAQLFDENLEERQHLRLLLVYDEVHRLLPKFGGSGEGFRQIERAVREFRKWGVGLILVSQVLSDFVGEIKANIGTEIQMRTKYEGDLDRVRLKYGEEALQAVVRLPIGVGMVHNSDYNRGIPFFVAFRPLLHNITRLSDEEIAKLGDYDARLDGYAAKISEAEAKGIDVSDAKLELSLAADKLKAGSFSVAEIYFESLEKKTRALPQK
jgi:hypothetical protein